MDREKLLGIQRIISHQSCADGTASAMICAAAYAHLGLEPMIEFVQYDTREHNGTPAEDRQLWVDITPPKDRWQEWQGRGAIVLDHHETVESITNSLGGVYGGPDSTGISGASLAFEHVMKPLMPQEEWHEWSELARLVAMRDTWQQHEQEFDIAQGVAAALAFYGQHSLLKSARHGNLDMHEIKRFGNVLFGKTMAKARKVAEGARRTEQCGMRTAYFCCTEKLVTEVAHVLIDEQDFDMVAGYFWTKDGDEDNLVLSLRSKKGGVRVNKIAEEFKGGGHPPAAGFRVKKDAADMSPRKIEELVGNTMKELIAREVLMS